MKKAITENYSAKNSHYKLESKSNFIRGQIDLFTTATVVRQAEKYAYKKSKGRCLYCGGQLTKLAIKQDHAVEQDHGLIPSAAGGMPCPGNLVTACHACNSEKSESGAIQYISERLAAGQPTYFKTIADAEEFFEEYVQAYIEAYPEQYWFAKRQYEEDLGLPSTADINRLFPVDTYDPRTRMQRKYGYEHIPPEGTTWYAIWQKNIKSDLKTHTYSAKALSIYNRFIENDIPTSSWTNSLRPILLTFLSEAPNVSEHRNIVNFYKLMDSCYGKHNHYPTFGECHPNLKRLKRNAEIIEMWKSGVQNFTAIAKMVECHSTTVSAIIKKAGLTKAA